MMLISLLVVMFVWIFCCGCVLEDGGVFFMVICF